MSGISQLDSARLTTALDVSGTTTVTGSIIGGNMITSGYILSSSLTTGSATFSGSIDANNTADIADTLTLSKSTGKGLVVLSDTSLNGGVVVDNISVDNIFVDIAIVVMTTSEGGRTNNEHKRERAI